MVKFIYCAYPIDQANSENLRPLYDLIESCQSYMLGGGIDVVFDPGDAFKVAQGARPTRSIDWVNRRALYEAEGMVAFLPAGVPTIGVPTEIERARAAGKPVAILTDVKSWMFTPTTRLQLFDLNDNGAYEAAVWLAEMEALEMTGNRVDPLPVLVTREGSLPTRGYADDAGLDLVVSKDSVVLPGCSVDIPCGVAVELPPGTWGLIIGRSSTRRTRGLLVHPGVIDVGWRGELFVCVENQTVEPVRVQKGERVGQLIVMPNYTARLVPEEVVTLNPSERGTNGFGSTGV